MNVEYLIQLLGNRLNALNTAKEQAFLTGDLDRINTLDSEINGVIDTLNKLRLLQGISETALVTPFTEAEVVQNGIEASFIAKDQKVIFEGDSTGVLLGYDISSYATDPLHEEKIADILNYIGEMDSIDKIDKYIDSEAISSPVKGYMIYNASLKWNVDSRLMMALMELDSRFGTAGVAIRTLNPGNIGNNDDGDIRVYSTWDEGVEAVAIWLNRHRIEKDTEVVEEPTPEPENQEPEISVEEKVDINPTKEEAPVVSEEVVETTIPEVQVEVSPTIIDPISRSSKIKRRII